MKTKNIIFSILISITFIFGIYGLIHYLFELIFKETLTNLTLIIDIPLGIIYGFTYGSIIDKNDTLEKDDERGGQ